MCQACHKSPLQIQGKHDIICDTVGYPQIIIHMLCAEANRGICGKIPLDIKCDKRITNL